MSNTNESITINRNHKDRLFCLLFGREENKHNILSLYNALNNSNYTNIEDIELTIIENAIYMTLINKIRRYKKGTVSMKDAINRAIDECIEEGVLSEFLKKHRGEVMLSCLTEFNEEIYREGLLEEGREEATINIAKNLLDILSNEEISNRLEIPLETVKKIRKENE